MRHGSSGQELVGTRWAFDANRNSPHSLACTNGRTGWNTPDLNDCCLHVRQQMWSYTDTALPALLSNRSFARGKLKRPMDEQMRPLREGVKRRRLEQGPAAAASGSAAAEVAMDEDEGAFIDDAVAEPEAAVAPVELDVVKFKAWARRQEDKTRVLLAAMADVAENGVVTMDVVEGHPVVQAELPDKEAQGRLDQELRERGLVEMDAGDGKRRVTAAGLAEYERIRDEILRGQAEVEVEPSWDGALVHPTAGRQMYMYEVVLYHMIDLADRNHMVHRQAMMVHPVVGPMITRSHDNEERLRRKGYIVSGQSGGEYEITDAGLAAASVLRSAV